VLTFPTSFPYNPPTLVFTSEIWHPNIYHGGTNSGEVCISILHPVGGNPEYPNDREKDNERWNPLHSVATIILSIRSLLSDPNFESPANVDASVQWRQDPQGFHQKIKHLVEKSLRELPPNFEWPPTETPRPIDFGTIEDDESEEEDQPQEDPLISKLVSMGFEYSKLEDAINQLKKPR